MSEKTGESISVMGENQEVVNYIADHVKFSGNSTNKTNNTADDKLFILHQLQITANQIMIKSILRQIWKKLGLMVTCRVMMIQCYIMRIMDMIIILVHQIHQVQAHQVQEVAVAAVRRVLADQVMLRPLQGNLFECYISNTFYFF